MVYKIVKRLCDEMFTFLLIRFVARLDPDINTAAFSFEEDELLIELVNQFGLGNLSSLFFLSQLFSMMIIQAKRLKIRKICAKHSLVSNFNLLSIWSTIGRAPLFIFYVVLQMFRLTPKNRLFSISSRQLFRFFTFHREMGDDDKVFQPASRFSFTEKI